MSASVETLKLTTSEVATLLRPEHVVDTPGVYTTAVMNYLISKLTASAVICYKIRNGCYPEPVLREILTSAKPELRSKLQLGLNNDTSYINLFQSWIQIHNHTHKTTALNAINFGLDPTELNKTWAVSMRELVGFARLESFGVSFRSLAQTGIHCVSRPHTILPVKTNDHNIYITSQPQFVVCDSSVGGLKRIVDVRVLEQEIGPALLGTSIINALAAQRYAETQPEARMSGGAATHLSLVNLDTLNIGSLPRYEVFMLGRDGHWTYHENLFNTKIHVDVLQGALDLLRERLKTTWSTTGSRQIPLTPKIAPFLPSESQLQQLAQDPQLVVKPKQLSLF